MFGDGRSTNRRAELIGRALMHGGGVGLYYPHVHFRDERWLKLASLYWDRIYRFHPDDDVEDSLPQILPAEVGLFGAGVIKHVTPSPSDLRHVSKQFEEAIKKLALSDYKIPVTIDKDRRLLHKSSSYHPGEKKPRYFVHSLSHKQVWGYLATWKATPQLTEYLTSAGLARPGHGPFIDLHPTLGRTYLLMLGAHMAPNVGASPITDDELEHAATGMTARRLMQGISGSRPSSVDDSERLALLVNLAIGVVIPRDPDGVSVEKLIRFRSKYAGERARFKDTITDVLSQCTQLDGITDRQVLIDYLQVQFDTRIRPALNDLERALRGQRIDTMWATVNLQTTVPPIASSALAILALDPAAPTAAAIGLSGFALGVWRSVQQVGRQQQQTLTSSPVAYLHHIRTDLDPLTLAERIRAAMARFAPSSRRPA